MLPSKWQNLNRCSTKLITCLLKNTAYIGLQAEQMFSINMWHLYFFSFERGFYGLFLLFPEALASCGKKIKIVFATFYLYLYKLKKVCLRLLNLVWEGVLAVRLVKFMLEPWYLVRKYSHICSFRKYTFSTKTSLILLISSSFLPKISIFWQK